MSNTQGVVDKGQSRALALREYLGQHRQQIASAIPNFSQLTFNRLSSLAEMAALRNPKLYECSKRSMLNAVMQCAADGIAPDGRHAVILPFWSDRHKTYIAQYIIMVLGLRDMIYRSGEIVSLEVHAVYESDFFTYELGDTPQLIHRPDLSGDRGDLAYVYSIARFKDGTISREIMTVVECDDIRQRSKAKDSGPWKTDFVEMCKKTVVRRHSKSLPMASDFEAALMRPDEPEELQRQQISRTPRRRLEAVQDNAPQEGEGDRPSDVDPDTGEVTEARGEAPEAREEPAPADEGTKASDERPKEVLGHPDYQIGRDNFEEGLDRCMDKAIRADAERFKMWGIGWADAREEFRRRGNNPAA